MYGAFSKCITKFQFYNRTEGRGYNKRDGYFDDFLDGANSANIFISEEIALIEESKK